MTSHGDLLSLTSTTRNTVLTVSLREERPVHEGPPRWEHMLHDDSAGWTFANDKLTVWADTFGMVPLYVGTSSTTLVVGRSASSVAAALPHVTPDDDAMAVLLRLGSFCGNDTFFREVRRIAPGERISWRNGQVECTVTPLALEATRPDRAVAIDRYLELFREAMRVDHAGRDVIVPLSGGRDSRHILAEAARHRHPVTAVSADLTAFNGANDHEIALMLCRRLGIPCHVVAADPRPWKVHRHNAQLLDAECMEHSWVHPIRSWLRRQPDAIVYDGLAGDTLSEARFFSAERLHMLRHNQVSAFVRDALGHDTMIHRMLPRRLYRRWSHERAVERLSREVARHCDTPNPVASFRLFNRTRRAVSLSSFRLLGDMAEVRIPYLWPPLARWLLSIEGEFFVHRGFHTETIARGFPQLADIPYEQKLPRPRGLRRRQRFAGSAFATLMAPTRLPVRRSVTAMMLLKNVAEEPFGDSNVMSVAEMCSWLQAVPPEVYA